MVLAALIDKQDTFEIVRDQVAAILAAETVAQQALATAAGKDPSLWTFRTYIERADAWPFFQNTNDVTPIVSVWWDSDNINPSSSNQFSRQNHTAAINIDCYGAGLARNTSAGHVAGDKDAALTAQRTARLVRNILMASEYRLLGLDSAGLGVAERWISNRQSFQPQQDNDQTRHVAAIRLRLDVRFNEYSQEVDPSTLELITHTVTIDPSGEVISTNADFTA